MSDNPPINAADPPGPGEPPQEHVITTESGPATVQIRHAANGTTEQGKPPNKYRSK